MITLNPVLGRFAERMPLPVMARAILERCLNAKQLDGWFKRVAQAQYTRRLLFSSLFELMTQVVLRQQPSVHAACRAAVGEIGVSVTSVYNKLNGLEVGLSAGLVEYAAAQAAVLVEELGATHAPLLAGVRIKVLDGTCLKGREHRLKETRGHPAGPLPGKALAVFDPALEVITALYPCEDAYTQERALLGSVLAGVEAGELWIADRNFCTAGFLNGLAERGALALIRAHQQLRFTPLEALREIGRIETGTVAEQDVQLSTGLRLRRLQIRLDRPTRNGENTLALLTTVPVEGGDGSDVSRALPRALDAGKSLLALDPGVTLRDRHPGVSARCVVRLGLRGGDLQWAGRPESRLARRPRSGRRTRLRLLPGHRTGQRRCEFGSAHRTAGLGRLSTDAARPLRLLAPATGRTARPAPIPKNSARP
jgi:hypothetical protein